MESSEAATVSDIEKEEEQVNNRRKEGPCVCGLCNCSKRHQCPVHLGLLKFGSKPASPKSEYRSTFKHEAHLPRRSYKMTARVLPSPPRLKMDSITVYNSQFPVPPLERIKLHKPLETYIKSDAKFSDETSHKMEFPFHPLIHKKLKRSMGTTLPTIVEAVPSYETSHETFYKGWEGRHRPTPYCEREEQVALFAGRFSDDTVTGKEFVTKNSKRPPLCKRAETDHKVDAKFEDATIHKEAFGDSPLSRATRVLPHLKNKSKKNQETIDPLVGKFEVMTQYREDNPGYLQLPKKRNMSWPVCETISLSDGNKRSLLPSLSVQKTSFQGWDKQPRPSTPCRIESDSEFYQSQEPLSDSTNYRKDFRPFSKQTLLRIHQPPPPDPVFRDPIILSFEKDEKNNVKQRQIDSQFPSYATVNKSDYFQFSRAGPRILHGDKAEHFYVPSTAKFAGTTHYESTFVPKETVPVKNCKPIVRKIETKDKIAEETEYKEQYPILPLLPRKMCPAELVLKNSMYPIKG